MAVFWVFVSAIGVHAQDGAQIFVSKCAQCHTIGRGDIVGPDLIGVVDERDPAWLTRWLLEPDRMLAERDELATQLLNEYKRVAMPNSNLDEAEVESVIEYMRITSETVGSEAGLGLPPSVEIDDRSFGGVQSVALAVFLFITAIILAVFFFVAESTAEPKVVDVKSAYKLRRVFFISGSVVLLSLLAITLPSNPYDLNAETADEIVYTTARQFSFSYSREPVTSVEELGQIPTSPVLEIAPDTLVEFRVTSLDATHGFAVYDLDGAIIAQTQAMPGYINRLRIRFDEAGRYPVLCLEFCGNAHHLMRSSIFVVDDDQPDQEPDQETERD